MRKIKGFDYSAQVKLELTRKEWKERVGQVLKEEGLVKTIWGEGETLLFARVKSPDYPHLPPSAVLVAEIYETGFDKDPILC